MRPDILFTLAPCPVCETAHLIEIVNDVRICHGIDYNMRDIFATFGHSYTIIRAGNQYHCYPKSVSQYTYARQVVLPSWAQS